LPALQQGVVVLPRGLSLAEDDHHWQALLQWKTPGAGNGALHRIKTVGRPCASARRRWTRNPQQAKPQVRRAPPAALRPWAATFQDCRRTRHRTPSRRSEPVVGDLQRAAAVQQPAPTVAIRLRQSAVGSRQSAVDRGEKCAHKAATRPADSLYRYRAVPRWAAQTRALCPSRGHPSAVAGAHRLDGTLWAGQASRACSQSSCTRWSKATSCTLCTAVTALHSACMDTAAASASG